MRLLFAFSLIAASVLLLAKNSQAAEITLRAQHFLGEESAPHQLLLKPWAQRIEQQSGGRIKVEIHPSMGLGGRAPDLVKQVKSGEVDIIWTAAAYTPGAFPRTQVFSLPLVHKGNPTATNLAIADMLNRELHRDYEGLHPLTVHVHRGHAFHLTEKPVTKLADFKGLVIRPPGRYIGRWIIEALGAEITKKRHPKLPRALKAKKLDGALMSFHLADSMGVIDVVKHHTIFNGEPPYDNAAMFGTSIYLFLMNKARYDALPKELRTVIDNNSGPKLAAEAGKIWLAKGQKSLNHALTRKNRIAQISPDERLKIRSALNEVLSLWAKDVHNKNIRGLMLIKKARIAIARQSE